MKASMLVLSLLLLSVPALAHAESEPQSTQTSPAGKVKEGVKEGARTVGHAARETTRAIGHGTRDAAKAVGNATRDAARETKAKAKEAWNDLTGKSSGD